MLSNPYAFDHPLNQNVHMFRFTPISNMNYLAKLLISDSSWWLLCPIRPPTPAHRAGESNKCSSSFAPYFLVVSGNVVLLLSGDIYLHGEVLCGLCRCRV